MSDDVILVLGATGKTGRRVARRLREAGRAVRAASRSSAVRFDWNDPATWDDAVAGVSAVYLVAPAAPGPAPKFVRLAVAAGVRRFVALSGRAADTWGDSPFGRDMLSAEAAVRESGVDWTIMRATNFDQNFDEDVFHGPIMAGELALPAEGVVDCFVDVEDVADVAVALLTEPGHAGATYELSGPRALTFREATEQISRASGHPVRYTDLTPEEFVARGASAEEAAYLVEMFALMRRDEWSRPTGDVRRILGREPRTFESYVDRVWRS